MRCFTPSCSFLVINVSNHALTNRTAPPPLLSGAPYLPSIAWATCEMIGRVSTLLYFVAEVSLELPVPVAAWVPPSAVPEASLRLRCATLRENRRDRRVPRPPHHRA